MKQTDITIDSAIDGFIESVEDQIKKMIKPDQRIILGIASGPLQTNLELIEKDFTTANDILTLYCAFFKGKSKSFKLFESEILPMSSMNREQADTHVKLAFVEYNDISIPSFPRFSKTKIVHSIDYTPEEIHFFTKLKHLLDDFRGSDKNRYTEDFFDKKSGMFIITSSLTEELTEKFTKKMSMEQIAHFVSLTFFVSGLNSLSDFKNSNLVDDTVQQSSLNSLMRSIISDLKFTKDGIAIDSGRLKERFGFNEVQANIRVRIPKKKVEEAEQI